MKTLIYISSWLLLSYYCNCLIAQQQKELKSVVAQKGDGIYKILRENDLIPIKNYYDAFIELNKDKIKDNHSLIVGEKYYLPAKDVQTQNVIMDTIIKSNNSGKFELKYADTVVSDKLKGAVFYLIPGHGGPDPGATAFVDGVMISEDEYAYDICLRLARQIEMNGGVVYMIIIDTDDGIRDHRILKIDYDELCHPDLEIPRDHNQRLLQRSKAVNDLYKQNSQYKYHRAIEIHLDSRGSGVTTDVFFYYFPNSAKGKKTAENIHKTFAEKYAKHQPNRGYNGTVSERNLMVMRKVLPPLVFIELGNIQNERDRKRFLDYNNREALAKWICEGLISDFEK